MEPDKLTEVYRTADAFIELQFICAQLRDNGISFTVKGESAGEIYGIIVDGLAEKRIYVKAEDADRAKEVIEEAKKVL